MKVKVPKAAKIPKSERLMNLTVMLLETSQPYSAEEIRRTIPGYGKLSLSNFKRAFERDKADLRETGIPIDITPDKSGTFSLYQIPKERYYLPDLHLDPKEVAALWIAAGLVRRGSEIDARNAVLKMGDPPRKTPERVTADLSLRGPNLQTLVGLIEEKTVATFEYGKKERRVHPYGLVYRSGKWYLVGHDEDAEDLRTFRLDRISGDVSAMDSPPFEVPSDFDAQQALGLPPFLSKEAGVSAEVRFQSEMSRAVALACPWLRLEDHGDWSHARLSVADEQGFVSFVLSFGEGAEVLSPQSLRDATRVRLEGICGF